jgi:hypothetical protein
MKVKSTSVRGRQMARQATTGGGLHNQVGMLCRRTVCAAQMTICKNQTRFETEVSVSWQLHTRRLATPY